MNFLFVKKIVADRSWFSPDPMVSSTNKTDCHDIIEILLKVAFNTIKQKKQTNNIIMWNNFLPCGHSAGATPG
jgi:hypothetical protein